MERSVYEKMASVQDEHWWFEGRRAVIKTILDKIHFSQEARILEIGAGTGSNLSLLSNYGEVVACEYDAESREVCKKSGWNVHPCELPHDLPGNIGKFDIICLFDVLEHVKEDNESIQSLKELLRPNGKIIIACPAYQWLYSDYDVALGHFKRYSESDLIDLASKNNLTIERSGYFNTFLFPLSLAGKLVESCGIKARSRGLKVPPKTINLSLKSIFKLESNFIKNRLFPFGTTVIIQARLND